VWWFGTGNRNFPVARARVFPDRRSVFINPKSEAVGTVQSVLSLGGRGREIFVLATCPLQFTEAGSRATHSQQGNVNSEDLQQDGFVPVRRKSTAPLSVTKEQAARAISAYAQCACLLSSQIGSIN
jgi:hypothetical protein